MNEDKTQVDVDTSEVEEQEQSHNEQVGDSTSTEELEKLRELAENYRIRAEKAEGKLKTTKSNSTSKTQPTVDTEDLFDKARQAARQELEQRDLEEMEYSDSIKESIQKIAQLNNISIRKASQDPYIQSLVEREMQQARVDEAASNGVSKGSTSSNYDGSQPLSAENFKLDTEEGRKAYLEAKQVRAEYMRKNYDPRN